MRIDPRFHGDWAIKVLPEYHMTMIKGKGAWNLETSIAYTEDFKNKIKQLMGKPWVSVGYAVDWELGTPETEEVIHNLYEWMVDNGCLKQITVILNPISIAQLNKYIEVKSPCYSVKLVSTIEDLMSSLDEVGFYQPIGQFDRFIKQPY